MQNFYWAEHFAIVTDNRTIRAVIEWYPSDQKRYLQIPPRLSEDGIMKPIWKRSEKSRTEWKYIVDSDVKTY